MEFVGEQVLHTLFILDNHHQVDGFNTDLQSPAFWALYGPHLTFKAWRESRSRQENRYGRHAVHIIPLLFYGRQLQ